MTQQPDFSAYGAVDLSALAAQRAARERAAAAAATADPGAPVTVVAVDEASFQAEVVDRSMTVPVVLDLWADWCGPCKQLSPLLERLARADGGAWVLATVDVDANQRIAASLRVQSIPTVFVVWQGQLMPGFTGALPEAQVRAFLDEVLAVTGSAAPARDADVVGIPADDAPPDEPTGPLQAAEDALAAGDLDGAAAGYAAALAADPGDTEARAGLARVELVRRLDGVEPTAVLAAADAAPDDIEAATLAADVQLAQGDPAAAFGRLVALVARSSGAERDRARAHLLELIGLLDPDDPEVLAARRALASALF